VILDIAIYKLCIYLRKNKDQILVFYVISSIDIYKLYAYSRKDIRTGYLGTSVKTCKDIYNIYNTCTFINLKNINLLKT